MSTHEEKLLAPPVPPREETKEFNKCNSTICKGVKRWKVMTETNAQQMQCTHCETFSERTDQK